MRALEAEVTPTIEEYLEAIYKLQSKQGVAKTSEIVEALKVAIGTVTNTVERLERDGLLVHEPYKGVKLTKKGLELALRIIRRHRLSEKLLTDFIGLDWARAHEEACRLEHGIGDYVADRLEEALGNPKTCPHGNPIPSRTGKIQEQEAISLLDATIGEDLEIVRISEEDEDMLHYLDCLSLKPGVALRVGEKAPFDGPITLIVDGRRHSIGNKVASLLWVKPLERRGGEGGIDGN
ncbi:metal-dependent transcriptional regulator [Candidatus Bathyarchaeota archaeon]|nr:metal-dependent transcriptional regulator [Candidatus Bathyarchaeota archaeon]MBS7627796.1 metal-dependent transcriptional regulator [Candidatus Bathyarchaeota archaeon]